MDNQNKNQNYAKSLVNNSPEGMGYSENTVEMTHGQLNSMLPDAPENVSKMTNGQQYSTSVNMPKTEQKMTNGQSIIHPPEMPVSSENIAASALQGNLSQQPAPISENAARLLLQEETRKTEQSLSAQEKKSKKLLKVVIVVAVILCVAGLAFALIMQLQNHDTSSGSQAGQTPPASTPDPEEEDELVALSVDDELVRKLYDQFARARVGFSEFYPIMQDKAPDGWFGIAADGEGNNANLAKLGIAIGNLSSENCRATIENGKLQARYPDVAIENLESDTYGEYTGCFDETKVKDKLQEIFGESFEFYPLRVSVAENGSSTYRNAIVSGSGVYAYDSELREFYPLPAGAEPRTTMGGLYAAERDAEHIYLYETLANVRCAPAPALNETTQEWESFSSCGLSDIEDYSSLYAWNTQDGDFTSEEMIAQKDQFPRYKWTFTKTANGNYIFGKLEKL